jgi:2-iminoacetate synthase
MNTADIKEILTREGLDRDTGPWSDYLRNVSDQQVKNALRGPHGIYDPKKLAALISPAAEKYLEQMARESRELTIRRFGRTIRLYAPLYLSSYCINSCRYCGFNNSNKLHQSRLSIDEAMKEAETIAQEGFTDILLVSGEDREHITVDYLARLAGRLREIFSSVSVEIYQLSQEEYGRLFQAGIEGVTIYQETYNAGTYRHYHPSGPKSDYTRRLMGPSDAASAQMREIGLGALLGLADWRLETLAMARHAHCLMKQYWQTHISFSFPRLRPAYKVGAEQFRVLTDKNITQMITALRLCFADAGLVLSTREPENIRNNLVNLGITRISAGSKTNPGGYSGNTRTTGQFEISDCREPSEIAEMIRKQGMEPVWKDWDRWFANSG